MSEQNRELKEILDRLDESLTKKELLANYFTSAKKLELIDLNDSNTIMQTNNISSLIQRIKVVLSSDLFNTDLKNITTSYESLVQELHSKIYALSSLKIDSLQELLSSVKSLLNNIEGIKTLNAIAEISNTVILVGANGSGKSSYVSNLKKVDLPGLFVIPAQKYLYFDSDTGSRNEVTVDSYQNFLRERNLIEIAKKSKTTYNEYKDSMTYPFSYLITALVKEYAEISVYKNRNISDYSDRVTLWDELEKIWNQLIPNIKFEIEPNERTISIEKEGKKYGLNGLSDGEKCILFYIGNVLIAPNNSYIVVDEPETFLNPSIYNKLWDMLISIRKDCQFIFTSHTMEFINGRTNSTFVWCKKFIYPEYFELQVLNEDIDFPMPLLTELVGSRKPILFCEGTYDSIDYQLLSKVFMNQFFVKPVSGHKEVINYTKGYNALSGFHGNISYGLIDGDFLDSTTIEKYQEMNVYVLPFNEIEMILATDSVINSVLKPFTDETEREKIIQNFKKEFFDTVCKFQEKILLDLTKKLIDRKIMGCLVENYSSVSSIELQVRNIPNQIDVSGIYADSKTRLKEYLLDKNYFKVLGFCNLKGQIINGLGNKLLMQNYKNLALKRISQSDELQESLRKNYFSEIPFH